jgi:hypothetical protein
MCSVTISRKDKKSKKKNSFFLKKMTTTSPPLFWCIVCDCRFTPDSPLSPFLACRSCPYAKTCSPVCFIRLHQARHPMWCVAEDDGTGALPFDPMEELSTTRSIHLTGNDEDEFNRLNGILRKDTGGLIRGTCGVPKRWALPVLEPETPRGSLFLRRFAVCVSELTLAAPLVNLARRTDPLKLFENAAELFDPKTRLLTGKTGAFKFLEDSKAFLRLQELLEDVPCEREREIAETAFAEMVVGRARPLDHPFTWRHGPRAFCLMIARSVKGGAMARIWVDVTYSKDPVQRTPNDPVPQPVPDRCCAVCDGLGAKVCATCRARRYCSAACQRADWKEHKKDCVAKE